MTNKKVISFIEKHKELIEEENFDALYIEIKKLGVNPAALTEVFLGAGIDPMIYFHDTIPYAYAATLPLTTIKIPDGILSVGTYAFSRCSDLTSVALPESLTSIRAKAFSQCSKLININLPETVSNIGPEAFEFCYGLKNIKLPEHLTTVELGCFNDCEGLESVVLGNKLEAIKAQAFSNCSNLSSLVFPKSLESISPRAFDSCSILRDLTFLGPVPPSLRTDAFANCPVELIHFEGSTTAWKNTTSTTAFDPSTQIKVICRNGEIFKKSQDSEWRE